MKQFATIIVSLMLFTTGFSQSASHYYNIRFTDKGIDNPFNLSNPSAFLSQAAIERRIMQKIPLDYSDLPVNPVYLNNLKNLGLQIVYSSKWLNTVIVSSNDPDLPSKLKTVPFIKTIERAEALMIRQNAKGKKQLFEQEVIEKSGKSHKGSALKSSSSFDYGASLNQVQMLKIDQLHSMGFTGAGVTIAVIDAGFNSADVLPAFDSLRMHGQIMGTKDFVEPGNNVYNTSISAHGMMVLSTMGGNLPGQLIGTAPSASYYLLRSEDALAEYLMEEYYWVNAAEYADSVGADIINSSLGYTQFDNPAENHTYADMDGNTTVVTIGADMAAAKGILVVNSAGNSGSSAWLYIGAPADGDSVFTIGAVDPGGAYASFSSIGPTSDGRIKPDVAAQGVSTIVAVIPTGIGGGSGTSFSSPLMAGASACLWQANPTYSNMELINAIKQSASQANNPDNYKGWGIPDFVQANTLLTSIGTDQKIIPFTTLHAYPIPFVNKIYVEIESSLQFVADLRLINSVGKSVKALNGIEINKGKNLIAFSGLENVGNGIYMLQITDGHFSVSEKIMK